MDITSLLNTKTPEPEEVPGSRTTSHERPPFIEPKPLNILPLPNALQQLNGSIDSQTSPSLSHSIQPLPARNTPTREQPPRLLIPPQLPPPTMSQIAYPVYPGTAHYTVQQPQMMQSPPSAITHSAATDDSMDMSGVNKTFPCHGCSKSFARKSDLVRHERIHSGERPHSCDFPGCDKQFIQRSALTVHKRVHTGEKPHKCSSCDKPFSDSSSLARHRRIHSGKRPYKCPVPTCQKTFTRKTTLTRHEQQHNPNRDALAPVKTEPASQAGQHDTSQIADHESPDGEASASEASDHATDTSPMSGLPSHQQGSYHDMGSYPGNGPAQYASKALDMNTQDTMGPYYRAQAYNHHTAEPRQPGQATMAYPTISPSGVEVMPAAYHVGASGDTYEAARRPSMNQGVSLYPSPEQHTRNAPFPAVQQQQQQQTYPHHDPRVGLPPQYQPAVNDWNQHHHHTM